MRNKKYFPLLILIPFFVLFILFRLFPIIMTGFRSIFDFKNGEWIYNNFNGYIKIVTDSEFYKSIGNTMLIFIIYFLVKLPGVVLVSYLICTLGKSKKLYIKFLYLPMLVGMFAYGIIFRYMFTYNGIINSVLYTLFHFRINWLGNSFAAQNVLAFAMLWGSFGINVLMISNVINRIPVEQMEYVKSEGASWLRIVFQLILPAIFPMIITIFFTSLIETIGLIDVPINLTQGGPEFATVTLGYYIYKVAFDYSDFSYASTVSVSLLIVVAAIISIIYYTLKKEGKKNENS